MKYLFLLTTFIYGCAVVVHPTGGPKDETPPSVKNVSPDSNTLNFQGKTLKITFDEYIEIKDANGFIFSPPLKEKPKISVGGKTVSIHYKETLYPNTTYTLQIINAVSDITEKTALPKYELTFSTGNVIDTSATQGYVTDNMLNDPSPGFTVALFNTNNKVHDSLLFPLYITKTNADGYFRLKGIKPGYYSIYAFEDINNNLKIEQGEKIAFINDSIQVPDTNNILLYATLYKSNERLRLTSGGSKNRYEYVSHLVYPKKREILLVPQPLRNDKNKTPYYYIQGDSIHIFDPYAEKEQKYLLYANQVLQDSLEVSYKENIPAPDFSLVKNPLDPNDTFSIKYQIPINQINTEYITLLKDSVPISFKLNKKDPFNIQFIFKKSSKSRYSIIIRDSAINDVLNSSYKTDTLYFQYTDEKNLGSIIVKWNNPSRIPFVVELLKDKTKDPVYTLISSTDSAMFDLIPADEYFVRIYADTGTSPKTSVIFDKQAVRVYYAATRIKLRSGWTIPDVFINIKDE